jgi:hypothetical protein
MGIQFVISPEKLKAMIKRAEEIGGRLTSKTTSVEVYYDSVPEGEELQDVDTVPQHFDIKTKQVDPEKTRAKIHPRIGRPKANHAGLYALTKKDMWLCKQDGQNWTLKVPSEDESGRTHLEIDPANRLPSFREANGERAIRRELSLQQDETTAARTGVPLPSLEEDLESRMNVVPYASFVNTVYKFQVPTNQHEKVGEILLEDTPKDDEEIREIAQKKDHMSLASEDMELGRSIDVELQFQSANFGYAHGQITALVENPDEEAMEEKMHQVGTVLNALNVELNIRANTPILEWLERYRPDTHHKQLVGASVAVRHNKKEKPVKEEKAEE